jgi:hypothetical protein
VFDSSSEIFCASVSNEILCARILVKCILRVFQRSALCECSSEVHCGSVLVKCFVQVF